MFAHEFVDESAIDVRGLLGVMLLETLRALLFDDSVVADNTLGVGGECGEVGLLEEELAVAAPVFLEYLLVIIEESDKNLLGAGDFLGSQKELFIEESLVAVQGVIHDDLALLGIELEMRVSILAGETVDERDILIRGAGISGFLVED